MTGDERHTPDIHHLVFTPYGGILIIRLELVLQNR